jgi:hypothetical protein
MPCCNALFYYDTTRTPLPTQHTIAIKRYATLVNGYSKIGLYT